MDVRFDQGDTGALNRARNDIALGVELDIVALNVEGVAVFGLLGSPLASTTAVITGAGNTRQITLDVDGPYRIRVTDDNLDPLLAERIYILNVPTAGLQMELPAHNGRSSPDANDVDPDVGGQWVLDSEMNVGGSFEGWHPGMVAAMRSLEQAAVLSQVSAGVISGFEVTLNATNPTTEYDVAEGVLETSDFTDPLKPVVLRKKFAAQIGVALLNPSTQQFTINGMSIAGLVQSNVTLTSLQRTTIAELPTVVHVTGVIDFIDDTKVLAYHTLKALSDYVRKQGLQNEGNGFTAADADDDTIQKAIGVTSGLFLAAAVPGKLNDRPDPAIPAPLAFLQSFQDGAGAFNLSFQTGVPIGFVDDGSGVLQTVPPAKYANYWLYFLNGGTVLAVGRVIYNSSADALAGIGSENPIIPPGVAAIASQVLRTVITVRANVTGLKTGDATFSQIQDPITGGASAVLSVQNQTGIVTLDADDIRGTGQWKAPAQVAHGFAVLDVLRVNGSGIYVKALADVLANAGLAIVEAVIDADNFHVAQTGQVTSQGHGLTIGATYYLSDSVAGALNLAPGTINQPMLVVLDADTVVAQNHRPT